MPLRVSGDFPVFYTNVPNKCFFILSLLPSDSRARPGDKEKDTAPPGGDAAKKSAGGGGKLSLDQPDADDGKNGAGAKRKRSRSSSGSSR